MKVFHLRRTLTAALLAGVALAPGASRAADLAATPDGAKLVVGFFKTYAGAAAASEPALVVKPAGDAYLVAIDIGALMAPLKSLGVSYDAATITFKVHAQDDGSWRIEQSDFPPIVGHQTTPKGVVDSAITPSGFKSSLVLDPALGWMRSGDVHADKLSVLAHAPGIEESFDFGSVVATISGQAGADGAVKQSTRETFGAIGFNLLVDPKLAQPRSITEAKAVAVTGGAQSGSAAIDIDGLKTKPMLDAWAYAVAHPSPANDPNFKTLLTALAATQPSLSENLQVKTLTINAPQGRIAMDDARFEIGATAAGPASHVEERFVANGLSLPETLAPAIFRDLVPTSFDIAFKLSGIDINAAAAEAVADMKSTEQGVTLSQEDKSRVYGKLFGPGPLVIDIPRSHVVAPQLDVTFEGQVQYRPGGRPTGRFTVHMRDFDKTVTAMKGLGPQAEQQVIPAFAMAKGLAKTESDGALSWVGEVGPDGVMKVNGLPLGKAPF